MPLKSTNQLPPGGWVYEQKGKDGKVIWPTKGQAQVHRFSPFNDACQEILGIRKNNGLERASIQEVGQDLDAFECNRLGNDPTWCASKKKTFSFNPVKLFKAAASHVQVAVERSGELFDGIALLKDWLGDGAKPVPIEQAQKRADTCAAGFVDKDGNPCACKFNKPGFKPVESAAEILRRQIEKKNELSLLVIGEENLHTCDLCWCHLPLKVHVPLDTILKGTPAPMLEKFRQQQPRCWIVTEQEPTNPA